ncbi:hypothetical protein PVAG01_03571 [Phlyctema vagabunda]|uniref:Uncharacterized protein n=1 Tax=Phlyctema vagabunda TaxID=108571 RepID=A0ABR4PLT0_9HELO
MIAQQIDHKTSITQTIISEEGLQDGSHNIARHQRDVSQDDSIPSTPRSVELPEHIFSDFGAPLPKLQTPHKERMRKLCFVLFLVTMNLCLIPAGSYYTFRFGTKLSLQANFAIITGVFGLLNYTHCFLRSLKLFREKTASQFRPIAWTRWGTAEFTQINFQVLITLVVIELVIATVSKTPMVRLCAMSSSTTSLYLSFVFLVSGILTSMRKKLPFNMSSTPKGEYWRPAMIAFIEDIGSIEMGSGVGFRAQVMSRWEASPEFRGLIELLNWMWGFGLLGSVTISTALVMMLEEDVAYGVGMGLPYVLGLLLVWLTLVICKRQLRNEEIAWSLKEESNSMDMEFA